MGLGKLLVPDALNIRVCMIFFFSKFFRIITSPSIFDCTWNTTFTLSNHYLEFITVFCCAWLWVIQFLAHGVSCLNMRQSNLPTPCTDFSYLIAEVFVSFVLLFCSSIQRWDRTGEGKDDCKLRLSVFFSWLACRLSTSVGNRLSA
jgi:hypothetical protein